MKKFLTVLLTFSLVLLLSQVSLAAGSGKGSLVIHFQQWEDDYADNLGSHGWEGLPQTEEVSGTDEFGVYWEFADLEVAEEGYFGFIAVEWVGGNANAWPDEGAKERRTGDVRIPKSVVVEDEETHIYVFEGANNNEAPEKPQHFLARPDRYNVMVIFASPTSTYSEDLGLHGWGWDGTWNAWADPTKVLVDVASHGAIEPIMGAMLHAEGTGAGFLVYEGDDSNKRTNDIKDFLVDKELGSVTIKYIVDAGPGVTSNENVYDTKEDFVNDAFTFRLNAHNIDPVTREGSGTFAVNPTQIRVELSAAVPSPYSGAVTEAEKLAAEEEIKGWFDVKEILGEGQFGQALEIDRVDFATSAKDLKQFVIILKDTDKLDNTKNYQLFFNNVVITEVEQTIPPVDVEEKEVTVTFRVNVPEDTPTDDVVHIAGELNGWTQTALTKVTEFVYEYDYTFTLSQDYRTIQFKFTRGDWANEELVASNRQMVIYHTGEDTMTVESTVVAWKDLDDEENPTTPAVPQTVELAKETITLISGFDTNIELSLDREAPQLSFISPTGIVGKPASQRIIELEWGKPFNQALFPRFRVNDDRDGEVTQYVFVPKGNNSVLDTRTEGDYTIMLEVSDLWGNVTRETFIFRVVKK